MNVEEVSGLQEVLDVVVHHADIVVVPLMNAHVSADQRVADVLRPDVGEIDSQDGIGIQRGSKGFLRVEQRVAGKIREPVGRGASQPVRVHRLILPECHQR